MTFYKKEDYYNDLLEDIFIRRIKLSAFWYNSYS
jgi:hypothetical protein